MTKIRRSSEQNRLMWSILRDIASQVAWHGQKMHEEDWKHLFSAALKRQRIVPGIDGGFVVLGTRTSQMTTEEMSDLIDLATAFGIEHDVKFSDAEQIQA